MRYIEPHGHRVSRTTDDYLDMVIAGCAVRQGRPCLKTPVAASFAS